METTRPEDDALEEAPDWLIGNIAEASKNARSLYLLYLGFVAYCVLTLATTTDRQLILDEGVLLPVIGLPVPLGVFFLAAPFLAIVFFAYLQLYLQRHRGLVKDLRENFKPVRARRLYPWILNMGEDPEPGSVGRLQRGAVAMVLWWLLPLALLLFVFVSLKRHEVGLSMAVASLCTAGGLASFYFWYQYRRPKWYALTVRSGRIAFAVVVGYYLVLVLGGTGLLLSLALEGRAFTVDLSYQVLITEEKEEYGTYWADLSGMHLEGANLESSVLRRTDLGGSFLQEADLSGAQLQGANLEGAQLQRARLARTELQRANLQRARLDSANLIQAQLQGADLQGARLQRAYLIQARLDDADLSGAQLQGADLQEAQLQRTDLEWAQLQRADLEGAQLQRADLSFARLQETYLIQARLDSADLRLTQLQGANLQLAQLQGADLQGAQLQRADLEGAQLQGANLQLALLQGADLREAQLQEARGLTLDLLCTAESLWGIEPDSLSREVEQHCPEKLIDPSTDSDSLKQIPSLIWH